MEVCTVNAAVYVIYDIHCGENLDFMGYLSLGKKNVILVFHGGTSHKDYHVNVAVTEYCRLLVSFFLFALSCFAVLAGFFIHSKYERGIICMHALMPDTYHSCMYSFLTDNIRFLVLLQ